jgi:hypothetical protein
VYYTNKNMSVHRNRVSFFNQALFVSPTATGFHYTGRNGIGIKTPARSPTDIAGWQCGNAFPPWNPNGEDAAYASGQGTIVKQLKRIQSCSYGFNTNLTDVSQYGHLGRISSDSINEPLVNLEFSYYLLDGFNERHIGLVINGSESPLAQEVSGGEGKNYFIETVPSARNVATGDIGIPDSQKTVVSIGNGFVTNYTASMAVNEIPTATVIVDAYNIQANIGTTGIDIPAINTRNGALMSDAWVKGSPGSCKLGSSSFSCATLGDPWPEILAVTKDSSKTPATITIDYSYILAGTPADNSKVCVTLEDQGTGPATHADFIADITAASSEWKKVFEFLYPWLTLNFVDNGDEAVGAIAVPSNPLTPNYALPNHNIGDFRFGMHPIDGAGNVLGHGYAPGGVLGSVGNVGGDTHFDSAEEWRLDSANPATYPNAWSIEVTAAHEMGHNFGLGHSDDPNSLMYYAGYANEVFSVRFPDGIIGSSSDLRCITNVYGDSSSVGGGCMSLFSLPAASKSYNGCGDVAALRPGDVVLTLNNSSLVSQQVSGAGALPPGTALIQSATVDFPLSRTNIKRIGNKYPFTKALDFPLTVSLDIEATVSDIKQSNLIELLCSCKEHELLITIYDPACADCNFANKKEEDIALQYKFTRAILESENFASAIGENKSVSLRFSTQMGAE